MQRLSILAVSVEPSFFEDPCYLLERRGCDVYHAGSAKDVKRLIQDHTFVLGALNALPAQVSPKSLRALHSSLRQRMPISTIAVVRPKDVGLSTMWLPDLHIVIPPLDPGYLLRMSARIIGVGKRRPLNALVQLHMKVGGGKKLVMGFLEDISRHGILTRTNDLLPTDLIEGVATFVLPGLRARCDVRVERTRASITGGVYQYGFAFTAMTAETFQLIRDFVGAED